MRKGIKHVIVIAILAVLMIKSVGIKAQLIEPMKGGERICWANNSLTSFYGPLDIAINKVFEAADPTFEPLHHQRTGKACGIIKEHYVWGEGLSDGTKTLDTLRNGNWDYFIMQSWSDAIDMVDVSDPYMTCSGQATDYPNNQDTLVKYMSLLDAEAKAVGARTIWFMPHVDWSWEDDYNKCMESATKVRAAISNLFFAPLIDSWDSVRLDYPPNSYSCQDGGFLEMLYSDCGHQNANGTALNAFTFYTILTGGLSAEGLRPSFPYAMENPEHTDYFARVGCAIGRKILLENGFPNDFEAPGIPEDLFLTNVTASSVTLNWTASTDNVGVKGYAVYMDGELYGETVTNSIEITGLTSGADGKVFTVRSIDAAKHYSSYSEQYPSAEVYYSIADTSRQNDLTDEDKINCGPYHILANKFDLRTVEYNITKATLRIYKIASSSQHDIMVYDVAPDTWYEGDPTFYSSANYTLTKWDTVTGNLAAGWQEIDVTEIVQNEMVKDSIASIVIRFTEDSDAGWTLYYSRESLVNRPHLIIETDKPAPAVDTTAPTAPSDVLASNITATTVSLDWTESYDSAGVVGYQIYHDGTLLATHGASTSMSLPWLTPETQYNITITATDAMGNMSAHSSPVETFTTLADTDPPTAPADLESTGETTSSISLSWTASEDNVGVTEYDIYNGAALEGSTVSTTFTVSGLSAATAYSFTVVAKDGAGNESAASNTLDVSTASPDLEAPTAPADLSSTGKTQTTVSLSWTASTDNVGVTEYDVYNGAALAGSTASTSYTVTGLTLDTEYTFTVKAKDAERNESDASNALVVTTAAVPDTEAPTAPAGLTSTSITQTSIDLSWTASTDNIGVYEYNIYNGAVLAGTSTTTAFSISGLTAGTAYSFLVKARDEAGNLSGASNIYNTETLAVPDTESPTAPTGLAVTAVTETSFTLSWTASTDNVDVISYEVFVDGTTAGTTSSTIMDLSGLTAGTTYALTISASDAAGNTSVLSDALNASTTMANSIFENESIVKVFPNPLLHKLSVQSEKNVAHIEIVNLTGIVEDKVQIEQHDFTLNVAHLSQGVYFINLQFKDSSSMVIRVVKR